MKTKHKYLLVLFWAALLADAYIIFIHQNLSFDQKDVSRMYTKNILMPLLMIYFLVNTPGKSLTPSRILAMLSLLFAWMGDILMLQPGETNLAISTACFLLMHVVTCIYFLRINNLFPIKKPMNVFIPLFLVGVYDAGLMYFFISRADHLEKLLVIYMAVISLMFMFAWNVLGNKKAAPLATQFFIPGAIFFLGSDSIFGLNEFLFRDHVIEIPAMLTYGFAQVLMVHGFIKHIREAYN